MLETVYGTARRLAWIKAQVDPSDKVVEVGCGTGSSITIPLLKDGYDIHGLDLHRPSVEAGKAGLVSAGLPPERIQCMDVQDYRGAVDVIIISEVMEHMSDEELVTVLPVLRRSLRPGGKMLVTVPNGYGWYEREAVFWQKLRLERLFNWRPLAVLLYEIRMRLYGPEFDRFRGEISSLSTSPHVQRFTKKKLLRLLADHGFRTESFEGSVWFSGPLTHALFSGCGPMMRFNHLMGRWLGRFASGFFVVARRP